MGIIGSAKLFQALAKDKLLPGLSIFGRGTKRNDEPILATLLTYVIAQLALLADLNQIATLISMGYQMTFFVMNLACFLLKVGSAPNFRPSFKFFSWQTACMGSVLSAAAMVFIDETYAAMAVCGLVFVFLLIHYLCPPKRWGDVSQNLIYHQVRKYLLRLKPEHIKFWRPHIILLVNDPRRQTRLIQFCNSLKKGSLYILGHVIVTDDFSSGVHEAKLQQHAWTKYISEFSRIKAFVELNMSPSIVWGVRNLVLSAGLGGMRPNIAILGFYNMDDLRRSNPDVPVPDIPASPATKMNRRLKPSGKAPRRHRRDTSARLLESVLPTDAIRTERMMLPTDYMIMLEDLALKYRLNVAVAYGFEQLETPWKDASNSKQYIDLWPIQMSAEVSSDGNHVLTTNFDTYTLILQLGHILRSVQVWREAYVLRVMVFVEYDDEVEEERARVKALLDKLRIEAEVWVFYLASGQLNTYELIINDNCSDIDTEIIVNDALKGEDWWEDLRMFRRHLEEQELYLSQDSSRFAHFIDSTCGRVGAYNPHEQLSNDRRRQSVAEVKDMPKQPDIATLSKLGVNMGIHTTHIDDTVLRDSAADSDYETALDDVIEDGLEDSLYSDASGAEDPEHQPLLQSGGTHGKATRPILQSGHGGRLEMREPLLSTPTSYGTESTIETMKDKREYTPAILRFPQVTDTLASPSQVIADRDKSAHAAASHLLVDPKMVPEFPSGSSHRSRSRSPDRAGRRVPRDGNVTPARPNLSRQSSAARFSSRPVPETKITTEGEGSKISFAPSVSNPPTPRVETPGMSRQSSLAKAASRPLPEPSVGLNDEGVSGIGITDKSLPHNTRLPRPGPPPGLHSRRPNHPTLGLVSPEIPEHVEPFRAIEPADGIGPETSTTISGPDLSLSFNDLPSRAQHLILNELMRKQSNKTAVLMTTLPIPSEETSLDEHATIQYLSNVEVLCNELPPTLLVLSNNVTVTVNL